MKPLKVTLLILVLSACNRNTTTMKTTDSTSQKSLVLVFNAEANGQESFWKTYEGSTFKFTEDLYDSGKITYLLPFSHQALKHPDSEATWTNSVIIGLNSETYKATANTLVSHIQNSELKAAFKSADLMQLQEGLNLFYAQKNGITDEDKLEQIVEYVFSDPKARKTYYEEQTLFSGPAMAELHSIDAAGRFIGYELEERMFGKDFPQWDVIHVVGFTEEHTKKATPIFYAVWDKHAEKVFGKGMTFLKKKSEWDTLRLNIKSNAKQQMPMGFVWHKKENKNN